MGVDAVLHYTRLAEAYVALNRKRVLLARKRDACHRAKLRVDHYRQLAELPVVVKRRSLLRHQKCATAPTKGVYANVPFMVRANYVPPVHYHRGGPRHAAEFHECKGSLVDARTLVSTVASRKVVA